MVSIFPQREERLFLVLPLLLLPLVLYSLYQCGLEFWGPQTETLLRLICSIVFLNTIHIIFCFKMLLSLPEFQAFRRFNDSAAVIPLFGEFALVFILSLLFFQWAYAVNTPLADAASIAIYILVNYHHSLKQVEGLGVTYDQALAARSPQLLAEVTRRRLVEKRRYTYLMGLSCVAILLMIFAGESYNAILRLLVFLSVVVVCFSIYLPTLWLHPLRSSRKGWFMLRLFYFPLGLIDPASAIALNALHGTEYLFFYRKMSRESSGPTSQRPFLMWAGIGAIVVLSLARPDVGLTGFLGTELRFSLAVRMLSSISFALAFVHFYIDGRLFNMGDPCCRETIGPLLTRAGLP